MDAAADMHFFNLIIRHITSNSWLIFPGGGGLSCLACVVLFDLVLHELVRLHELALYGRGSGLFLHLFLVWPAARLHRLRKLGRVEEVVQELLHVLGRHLGLLIG